MTSVHHLLRPQIVVELERRESSPNRILYVAKSRILRYTESTIIFLKCLVSVKWPRSHSRDPSLTTLILLISIPRDCIWKHFNYKPSSLLHVETPNTLDYGKVSFAIRSNELLEKRVAWNALNDAPSSSTSHQGPKPPSTSLHSLAVNAFA